MNALERLVYERVKRNYRLKRKVRDLYLLLMDLAPTPAQTSAAPIGVREGCFFGFHDKSPFSPDNSLLAAHKETIRRRMPGPDDEAEIGIFSGEGWMEYRRIGSTRAWNWHQGAMLQWLGQTGNVVFNDFDGAGHVARVLDPEGNEVARLPRPIAAVSPDGAWAVSHDFVRSNRAMSGYGYANGADPEAASAVPAGHGVWAMRIRDGRCDLVYSVADLAAMDPEPTMRGALHWVTHCQFAPSGERFKFFHRWTTPDGRRWTRMYSCGIDGSGLYRFPAVDMVSHVGWRDAGRLVAYASAGDVRDHYYQFADRGGAPEPVGLDLLTSDGHPSFAHGGRWMVTDTYPDRRRLQTLILLDMETGTRHDILRVRHPRQFVGTDIRHHWVADLHPRWDRTGSTICFDAAFTGVRSLCTVPVGDLTRNEPPSLRRVPQGAPTVRGR
ncbi:MAG: hypothetical protein NT029_08925 [Armatimonadetes bacterium]|nr:hypothetical protein [Armatimonadota bacterium]